MSFLMLITVAQNRPQTASLGSRAQCTWASPARLASPGASLPVAGHSQVLPAWPVAFLNASASSCPGAVVPAVLLPWSSQLRARQDSPFLASTLSLNIIFPEKPSLATLSLSASPYSAVTGGSSPLSPSLLFMSSPEQEPCLFHAPLTVLVCHVSPCDRRFSRNSECTSE